MATLNSGFNWDPDTFNGASFVGGIAATIVFAVLMWAAWRVSIGPAIEQHQRRKQAMFELRLDQMRSEIRQAVLDELGGDRDDDTEDLPDGSTRHPA
jgi:hypothetical protein